MSSSIRAAVLTVSDTASNDASADRSGPTLKAILNAHAGFQCNDTGIVPDDFDRIQETVKQWCDRGDIDLIITTGGTGFGLRDITPEAVKGLLDREAPGLIHLILSTSLKHTPLAALSRPVAGTIRNTLIVTFPGSVKAVRENIDALLHGGLLEHAAEYLTGGNGECVHTDMAKAAGTTLRGEPLHEHQHEYHGHSHKHDHQHDHVHQPDSHSHDHDHGHKHDHVHQPGSHSHDHGYKHDLGHTHPYPPALPKNLSHDPSAAVSARHRISPYPIISIQEAFYHLERQIAPLEIQTLPVTSSLRGHILATDVYAPQNVPLSSTSSYDGYALRNTYGPGVYSVVTSQTHKLTDVLRVGTMYRINTGGPLPAGADSIVMVEETRLVSTIADPGGIRDGEEEEVEVLVPVRPGDRIRSPGSDVLQGDLVLQKGERITSVGGEIGTLAFVGRKEVEVYKRPVIAILSTGNEIVDLHAETHVEDNGWGGIFDTNRPSLQATLEGMGYEVIDLGIVPDTVDAHVKAIQKGLDSADILLTTGGTSMGPADLLKPVIERHFNGSVHFGRVALKPGKPTTFATIPSNGVSKPIFALPGNPASALVTFQIFVVPALRFLGGWPKELCHLPRVTVQIQNAMNLDPRTEFHRVIIKAGRDGLKAFSTGGQRSSRVASLSGANGLVILPPTTPDSPSRLEVGANVPAIVIGELQML